MIVQNVSVAATGLTDISFTLPATDGAAATAALSEHQPDIGFASLQYDDTIGKLSLIGAGMRSHPGRLGAAVRRAADAGINIEMISTSEIRISVVTCGRTRSTRRSARCTRRSTWTPRKTRPSCTAGRDDKGHGIEHRGGRRHRSGRRASCAGCWRSATSRSTRSATSRRRARRARRCRGRAADVVVEDVETEDLVGHRRRPVLGRRRGARRCTPPGSPRRARSSSTTPRPGVVTPRSRSSSPRSTRARSRAPSRASSPTRTAPRWPRCRCSRSCTTRPGCSGSSSPPTRRSPGPGLAGARRAGQPDPRRRRAGHVALVHDGVRGDAARLR